MINDAVKQIKELRTKILKHFDELVCDGKYIQFRDEYIAADFPEWLEMEDELVDIVLKYELPTSDYFYYHDFLELMFLDEVSKEDIDIYCNNEKLLTTFMSSKYFDEIVINDGSIITLLDKRFKKHDKLQMYLHNNYNFLPTTLSDKDYVIVRKNKVI